MSSKKKHHRGIPAVAVILLCIAGAACGLVFSGYLYIREKYAGASHPQYSAELMKELDEDSLTYRIASRFYTPEQLAAMHQSDTVEEDWSYNTVLEDEEESGDLNGDGIEIQHVYGMTYEGYMMVIHDPQDVFIALNPGYQQGLEGLRLPAYIEQYDAVGGVNGGGFLDAGGNGDASVPSGIVIMDGKIVQDGTSAVIAFTKDHRLIATTASASSLIDMGVEEAITFGPTFIHNGNVVYQPTNELNMLNPRTAVGMQEDGTILLLVIDGRGPSSWGAKYEDVIKVFQQYNAVEAGNLDGGNSSVMMYNGRYVNYSVAMNGSRRLPDAILVRKGGRKDE